MNNISMTQSKHVHEHPEEVTKELVKEHVLGTPLHLVQHQPLVLLFHIKKVVIGDIAIQTEIIANTCSFPGAKVQEIVSKRSLA